jgi:hypothetical protein
MDMTFMTVFILNSLMIDGDFCHQGRDTEIVKKNVTILKILLKQSDMTIHWKALEEHFLTVPLVS